jgi:hypothetical protein
MVLPQAGIIPNQYNGVVAGMQLQPAFDTNDTPPVS